MVGPEPPEAVVEPALGVLGGPAAALGHQEDLVAELPLGEGLAHPLLGQAVVVVPGVVEEGDPFVDGALDQLEALAFVEDGGVGDAPAPQADQADHLAGLAQGAEGDAALVLLLVHGGRAGHPDGGDPGGSGLEELATTGVLRCAHGVLEAPWCRGSDGRSPRIVRRTATRGNPRNRRATRWSPTPGQIACSKAMDFASNGTIRPLGTRFASQRPSRNDEANSRPGNSPGGCLRRWFDRKGTIRWRGPHPR